MTQRTTSAFRSRPGLGLVIALAMVLGACSSGSDSSTTTTAADATTTTSAGGTTTLAGGTTTTLDGVTTTISTAPLAIQILVPAPLSTHLATVDLGGGELGAEVVFTSDVTGGDGDAVVVTWESDVDGALGTGLVLNATLSNDGLDVVQHRVTATASIAGGETVAATVEVVVKVPSN